MRMLKLGLPTPNPSQEGNVLIGKGGVFPSWEGLGVGKHASYDEIFQITFQVVFRRKTLTGELLPEAAQTTRSCRLPRACDRTTVNFGLCLIFIDTFHRLNHKERR